MSMKANLEKKLLLVGPKGRKGGHEKYVNDILRFGFKGFVVFLFNTARREKDSIALKQDSPYIDLSKINPILLIRALYITFLHLIGFVRSLFIYKPDIILITGGGANIFWEQMCFIILSKLWGKKLVLHYHGPFYLFWRNSSQLKRKLIKWVYNLLDRMMVLSSIDFNFAQNFLMRDKIVVVPNYISTDHYTLEFKEKLSSHDGVVRIVFLGGLEPVRKGIKDLIEAINQIAFYDLKVKFILSCSDEVKNLIEQNICDCYKSIVHYVGWLSEDEKRKLYQNSDIMVLPSYNEGLPFALIEAMASGMAIVSTNVGGIPGLVPSTRHGLIFEAGDVEGLKKSLLRLIRNKSLCAQMGKQNIERVRNYYTIDIIFSLIENLLSSVVSIK